MTRLLATGAFLLALSLSSCQRCTVTGSTCSPNINQKQIDAAINFGGTYFSDVEREKACTNLAYDVQTRTNYYGLNCQVLWK